jgi:hypothetical protein
MTFDAKPVPGWRKALLNLFDVGTDPDFDHPIKAQRRMLSEMRTFVGTPNSRRGRPTGSKDKGPRKPRK